MGALSVIFWGVIVLAVLVVVHELGHFIAARAFGVRVTDMSQDYHQRLYRIARETPFKEKG